MQIHLQDSEPRLVEMVSALESDSVGWRIIQFHFSRLLDQHKGDDKMKIAITIFKDALKDAEGGLFLCKDRDVIVVCKGIGKPKLDKMIFQVRYLFMDDPLAYTVDGHENEALTSTFDLSVAWDDAFAKAKKKAATAAKLQATTVVMKPDGAKEEKKLRPFTPSKLATVETDLKKADLSRIMRQQPVCASTKGSNDVRPVFNELYVNIGHLRSLVMSDVDFLSNRWLFRYLTEILDDRMMELLMRQPQRYFTGPVSLNLNVRTVLSERFFEFDEKIKPLVKGSVVIEMQIADVFEDMRSFLAAQQELQKLGYRVCLDGLNNLSFTQVDRNRLGFDLAKLQWKEDFVKNENAEEKDRIAKAVEVCGPSRVILCHCDDQKAIDYGQSLGISLFQGRHLDKIVNPDAKIIN